MPHHLTTAYDMPMHEGRELPQFTLRENDLPHVRTWEVNGKYYLIMEVEMTAKRIRKDLETKSDQSKVEGDFMVISIKVPDDKIQQSLEKQAFETAYAKNVSGQK